MEHAKVSAGALDDVRRVGIERSLRALSVPFRWEGAVLVVATADEQVVRRVVNESAWPAVVLAAPLVCAGGRGLAGTFSR